MSGAATKEQGAVPPSKAGPTTFERITRLLSKLIKIRGAAAVFVFVVAFLLRYLYNTVYMEHRICHFGDAYNYMHTGAALLKAIITSHGIGDFLHNALAPLPPGFNLVTAVGSTELNARLAIDGPVFPSYLALIEWISGINPSNPVFDAATTQISICNSVLDSVTCLLVYFAGRLAFNRPTAVLAGLLFATYPAAIINTQHCYSEQFCYFLLTIWTILVLRLHLRHTGTTTPFWCALGITTGVLMLSKPAFVVLPPAVALTSYIYWKATGSVPIVSWRKDTLLRGAIPVLAGIALIVLPWCFANQQICGQFAPMVNRLPAFNVFHGNLVDTDGWRIHPYTDAVPNDIPHVLQAIVADACEQPIEFAAFEFKKLARLWSGIWNEFQYTPFGIPLKMQYLWHQLLLFLAVVGLCRLASSRAGIETFTRECRAANLLSTIVGFHFLYAAFETISRYAMTAMPSVILLAAFAITEAVRQRLGSQLVKLLAIAIASFTILASTKTFCVLFCGMMPAEAVDKAPRVAWIIGALSIIVLFAFTSKYVKAKLRIETEDLWLAMAPMAVTSALVLATSLSYTVASYDWQEWAVKLDERTAALQSIHLPKNSHVHDSPTAFVLLDLSSPVLAPPLKLRVNGVHVHAQPFPLAVLQPGNRDIVQCLALQGQAMSIDLRTFRHWWVVPLPSELLHDDKNNELYVTVSPGHEVTLYGDWSSASGASTTHDGKAFLPSLNSYAYTKGFLTFDHRDPRVWQPIKLEGQTTRSALLSGKAEDVNDLSDQPGTQVGTYRLHILAAAITKKHDEPAAPPHSDQPFLDKELVGETPHTVSGSDPKTFVLPESTITLPANLQPGTRLSFGCQLRGNKLNRPGFVSVTLSGTSEDGKKVTWNSQWQPIALPVSPREWRTSSFCDVVPENILALKDLSADVLVSPFQPDLLFLKKPEATRCQFELRNVHLHLLPPLSIPDTEDRTWIVY